MADDRTLPGWPKKKLVKDVRRSLARYGIRPARSALWRAAWEWAGAVANSYWQPHWPLGNEIAAQYILLLLAEMKTEHSLKLAYRADKVIPAAVNALLANLGGATELANGQLDIPAIFARHRKSIPTLNHNSGDTR